MTDVVSHDIRDYPTGHRGDTFSFLVEQVVDGALLDTRELLWEDLVQGRH